MEQELVHAINDLSLNGEGCTRPKKIQIPNGKLAISEQSKKVYNDVSKALGLPESGIGLHACLHELLSDLGAAKCLGFELPTWTNKLQILSEQLALSGSEIVRDREAALSLRNIRITAYLREPRYGHDPYVRKFLRACRSSLALNALAEGKPISEKSARVLCQWLNGHRITDAFANSKFSSESLKQVRSSISNSEGETSKLITTIIGVLDSRFTDPFPPQATFVAPSHEDCTSQPEDIQDNKEAISKLNTGEKIDLLCRMRIEPLSAGPRVFSGISGLVNSMHPKELAVLCKKLNFELKGEQKSEALCALLTLFTRGMVSDFNQIRLDIGTGAGVWIDVDKGLVCWNLDEVLSKIGETFVRDPSDRFVRVPLPIEVTREIKRRFLVRPASHLGDLFDESLTEMAIKTKAFLRGLSITSHTPTLSRLRNSWSRQLLKFCNDEALASAAGLDLTVGTVAQFNYVTIKPKAIVALCRRAYKHIGFSGDLLVEDFEVVGSKFLPADEDVNDYLRQTLGQAWHLIEPD